MYQRTVLPNGIRVITEFVPHVRSVTLGVWFAVGSRHEQPEQQGISHFIEHMMFKGTEKYSARQIAEIFDQRGGYLNAFTGKEHTCYYFKVLDEHFSIAADVLKQMLLHSLFSSLEIAKERNVVLEELAMYQDSPEELVHDLFAATIWPEHPLGRNILGSIESINSFNREMILAYLKSNYTTDRLVITCVGNIAHEQVVESFASAFSQLPVGDNKEQNPPQHQNSVWQFYNKDTEQVHLCLGGPSCSRSDQGKYALHLLDTIIGGGVSSFLFQELREERGLVYNTYSFNTFYQDSGYYGVYAGFKPANWEQVWDVLCRQFDDFSRIITKDSLAKAKGQLMGSTLLALESTSNRMTRLAMGEFDESRVVAPDEIMARIGAVSYDELLQAATELYNPLNWTWTGLGPRDLLEEDTLCRKIC